MQGKTGWPIQADRGGFAITVVPTQKDITAVLLCTAPVEPFSHPHIPTCVCGAVGLMQGKTVMANPGRRVLTGEEQGIMVGPSQEDATSAMQVAYTKPPPLADISAIMEEAKTRHAVWYPLHIAACHTTPQQQCR